jgi:hypothetical protein
VMSTVGPASGSAFGAELSPSEAAPIASDALRCCIVEGPAVLVGAEEGIVVMASSAPDCDCREGLVVVAEDDGGIDVDVDVASAVVTVGCDGAVVAGSVESVAISFDSGVVMTGHPADAGPESLVASSLLYSNSADAIFLSLRL